MTKLAIAAALSLTLLGCSQPPERPEIKTSVWLEQGWKPEARSWFHHASQGTATLPTTYEWFVALEQPRIGLGEPKLFSDPAYLRRWGFIDSPKSADNPGGLPIGFALTKAMKDPNTGYTRNAIGFTCAACHTGQFTYQGTRVLVDGGPAQSNVTAMGEALGIAMVMTKYVPGRFDRFAKRVLGERYNDANVTALKAEYEQALQVVKKQAALMKATKKGSIEEGFARLDALTRIGNQVFGVAGGKDANYVPIVAPVSYPHIWNTSWFTWVQYDGSIMQPMVRNAGEALGVVAGVNLTGKADVAFESTVDFKALHAMETQLAGTKPPLPNKAFDGLQSPKWPQNVLGKIDTAKAEAGRALYEKHCQGCHLPAPNTAAFWDEKHWKPLPGSTQRYLDVQLIDLDEIGTDPAQARVLGDRKVDTTGMGLNTKVWLPDGFKVAPGGTYKTLGGCKETGTMTDGPALDYGAALGAVVQQTINRWYTKSGLSKDKQFEYDGDRPNCLNPYPMYKARPLNGVWSTPPFLHNGSVPTLQALLSPASERPATFWLGNLEFDPQAVGLVVTKIEGGTEIDTRVPGNHNTGHEFDDKPKGSKGVIGPRLIPEERGALIEYLKTL